MNHIEILLLVVFFPMVCVFRLLYRNSRVFAYRLDLIDRVHARVQQDLREDPNCSWKWRFEMCRVVPYYSMVWQFWKTMDSFYDEEELFGKRR